MDHESDMNIRAQRPSTFSAILQLGGPVFVVLAIVLPNVALGVAMALDSLAWLNYVHVMAGALWTGADLFMGVVIGPVMRTTEPRQRADFFKRLIPKMTFLMPMLATVTIIGGIVLAQRIGMLTAENPWMVGAWAISAGLIILGFGVLLPNEIRIFKQLISPTPDVDRIGKLGMQNAKLAGIQGLLQVVIIFVMANLRF